MLLAEAAHHARSAQEGRELAESELTRTLRTVLSQPDFRNFRDHIEGEDGRTAPMSCSPSWSRPRTRYWLGKFYNDAVAATIATRRRWSARVLRLAGNAPMPEFFEIDDTLAPTEMDEQGTDMPHLAG